MGSKALLTEKDIALLENRFKEIFLTKEEFQKHRSELFDKLDSILKEILASREEQAIMTKNPTPLKTPV